MRVSSANLYFRHISYVDVSVLARNYYTRAPLATYGAEEALTDEYNCLPVAM